MNARRIALLAVVLSATATCGRVGVDIGGSPQLDRANKGLQKLSEIKDVRDAYKEALNGITPRDERAIGQATSIALLSRTHGLVDDQPLADYVNQVGNMVSLYAMQTGDFPKKLAKDRARRFYFGVIDEPAPTAYSVPGGHVFVTRGLLEQLTSESELAFVLGHEIAHVDLEHGLFALKAGKAAPPAALEVLDLFKKKKQEDRWTERLWEEAPAFDGTVEQLVDVVLSWIDVAQPGQERDADDLGLQYAVKAGYDSKGAERVLEMLASSDSSQDAKSHDPAKTRLERLRKAIDREEGGSMGVERWNTVAAPRLAALTAGNDGVTTP